MRHFLLPFALLLSVSLAAQVPTYVPTDGLVAWYPFNGNADDESGNNLDGVVHGAVLSSNRFGQNDDAYFFAGDFPQYIALPELNANLGQSNSQTSISLWFLQESYLVTGTGQFIHASHEGYPEIFARIEVTQAGAIKIYHRNASTNNEPSGGIVPLSEWSFLCALIDQQAGTYSLWLNGEFVEAFDFTFDPSESYHSEGRSWELGAISDAAPYHQFKGTIDDVSVHSRILSEAEIISMYTASTNSLGCTNSSACNFDSNANLDDGSCIPSGCMEEGACNYNAAAECEGEACDYSCCPGPGCCGAGTHWDANLATCIVDIPDTVDTACTLMNLQELASGYAALVEQNAALDSINLAQQAWIDSAQGNISNSPSGPCTGENSLNYFNQEYEIIEINERCWFAQNLNTSQYSNGDSLARNIPISDWNGTSIGACDAYGFSTVNADTYGLLYNWHAVTDPRNLCPTSWHVASDSDWKSAEIAHGMTPEQADLSNFRGEPAGERFKASSANTPSWNGTDSLHFGGLPGGWRNENGSFSGLGTSSAWWTSSGYGCCYAQYRIMTTTEDRVFRNNLYYYFFGRASSGLSVRCVKD